MYNPGVTNISGQLEAQGISQLGQNISQLIQQYQQNKIMANSAIGEVESGIQANPEILQHIQDPNTPPAVFKAFTNLQKKGSLGVEDASLLSSFIRGYANEKAQAQQYQMNQYALDRANIMNQFLRSAISDNNAPAGQPSAQAQPSDQLSGLVSNPYGYTQNPTLDTRNFIRKTVASTGQLPQAAEINAFNQERNKWLGSEQQIGFVPAGNEYDADGNVTAKKVFPATMKPGQPGKIIVGKDAITLDPQSNPSLPLIDPVSGKKLDPATAFGANFNPNAKGAQDELASSYDALNKANESLSNARFFQGAVNAFAADPASGSRYNVLMGDPKFAKYRQLFTGKNPQAQIEAAQGKMYAATIDNLRNDKTGSNGIRSMTQQELTQLQSQYGQSDMTPQLQKVLADNTAAVMQKHRDMLKMYTDLRAKGMRPTDANAAVLADPRFSQPLVQNVDNPNSATNQLIKGKVYRNPKGQRAMWDGNQWVSPP